MSRLYQPNVDVYRYVVMRPSVVDLLDRLEPRFLGKPKRRLLLWFAPDSRLEPEERYSLRLYLRVALGPALAVDAFIILAMLAPLVYLWHRFPGFMWEAILHHGEAHALLIGFLVKQQYYLVPLVLVFLLGFSLLLHLPRFYFWNRRMARLARTAPCRPPNQHMDSSIWPPPPKKPAP